MFFRNHISIYRVHVMKLLPPPSTCVCLLSFSSSVFIFARRCVLYVRVCTCVLASSFHLLPRKLHKMSPFREAFFHRETPPTWILSARTLCVGFSNKDFERKRRKIRKKSSSWIIFHRDNFHFLVEWMGNLMETQKDFLVYKWDYNQFSKRQI